MLPSSAYPPLHAASPSAPPLPANGRADTRPSTATTIATRVCCGDNTGRPRTVVLHDIARCPAVPRRGRWRHSAPARPPLRGRAARREWRPGVTLRAEAARGLTTNAHPRARRGCFESRHKKAAEYNHIVLYYSCSIKKRSADPSRAPSHPRIAKFGDAETSRVKTDGGGKRDISSPKTIRVTLTCANCACTMACEMWYTGRVMSLCKMV